MYYRDFIDKFTENGQIWYFLNEISNKHKWVIEILWPHSMYTEHSIHSSLTSLHISDVMIKDTG